MSAVSVKRGVWQRWKRIFILTYPALGIIGLYNWIDWKSAAFFIGTLTLLHTPSFGKNPVRGFRWGWLTIVFSIGFLFLPVKIMLYLGLVSAVLLFRETFYRPTEPSVPIVLLLMTPLAEYFVRLFSFPVRLQLTLLASRIIGITGQSVTATGNILTWRGQDFSVDPACIGLHMLVASLLTALLLSNHYQKKYRVRLHPMLLFLLLGIVLGLNIVANLLRITLLVILMILPENPMHGFLGLMVWLIYVLLPMIPLIRWMTRRRGKKMEEETRTIQPVRSRRMLIGNWIAATAVMLVIGKSLLKESQPVPAFPENAGIPGYTVKRLAGAVLQLNNGKSLVYIKPIPDFYYTEHSPMICWEGSGYRFEQLQERSLQGFRLYEGLLKKEKGMLYTAWWYDNGVRQTAGTLDWRWDVLRGGLPYSIVNVTAASPQLLESEIGRIRATRPFRKLVVSHGAQ